MYQLYIYTYVAYWNAIISGVHRPQAPQRQLVAPQDLGVGGLGKAAADAVEGPKRRKNLGKTRGENHGKRQEKIWKRYEQIWKHGGFSLNMEKRMVSPCFTLKSFSDNIVFKVCWDNWTLKAESCKYAVKVISVRIREKEFREDLICYYTIEELASVAKFMRNGCGNCFRTHVSLMFTDASTSK